MNILYASSLCSEKKFKGIFNKSIIKPQQQAQKFHRLFTDGLKEFSDLVFVVSVLPISNAMTKRKWFSANDEIEGDIEYRYLPFINYPILRHICIFIASFFTCIKWNVTKRKGSKVVICDILNISNSAAALIASKLFGTKSVAIVTDVPFYMQSYNKQKQSLINHLVSKIYNAICNFFMYRYDSYIILTEQMKELVNPKGKPYIVIEGMVDSKMSDVPNKLEEKYREKIVIYAGALHEKYGVKKLIEGFMRLDLKDARLWLFGSGELVNEIRKYEKEDDRIKYFGEVPNATVVKEEIKATLLINPRSSKEEFTKFSFPSKNMEYMASGTPLLTAKLPGMPKEYYDYVYFFENETEEGITESLKNILSKNKDELYQKGYLAKKFVLKEKNNIVQAKRFLETLS